jgi:DNA repair and recombination RAD54-like protein
MSDHAIVLYDPTIDDIAPPEEEIDPEVAAELRRKKEEEAKGPHKSLRMMLGIVDKKEKKEIKKVPVVIDPRLAKFLRPHQVEGVKVCTSGKE